MCGISIAINTKGTAVEQSLIEAMNDKILHRGPDDAGVFMKKNFAFGHRRLSILDLTAAGHQPMQRKQFWITFNGEVYNYIELKIELEALGHTFKTGTDTEVILAAYEQWGVACFAKFNGMWAFAIYDTVKNEIIFCRDHFGIKPLYYSLVDDHFVAGSEIKQFTVVPGFRPVLNKAVAINFLVHGWLNYSAQTFFEGVDELPPGHYLLYDLDKNHVSITEWYNLDKAVVPVADPYEVAVRKVKELFIDSVKIRMRSDVKVGSCLSGGIDSSSIVAAIHSNGLANGSFATVTSCYDDKRYDEQQYSDAVTHHTGFDSLKVYPDLSHLWELGDLDKIIYHQDQPIASASHYSEFKVFETARRNGLIVMQDGQGADEYLCGYGEFYVTRVKEMIHSLKLKEAFSLLKDKASHRNTGLLSEVFSFIKTAYLFPRLDKVKRIVGKEQFPWLSAEWKKFAGERCLKFESNNVLDLSIMEIGHSSIPYQLHSEDRNSMLFSIESRLPFLDHRLVEYSLGLPSAYKIKNGYTKAVLRDAISELPEKIRYRKDKMGFVAPDMVWIKMNKEKVRADLEELLSSTGIFTKALLNRFDRFTEGTSGYEPIYFRALTFKRFCEIFKVDRN